LQSAAAGRTVAEFITRTTSLCVKRVTQRHPFL
jgi:hypothetical protein